MVTDKIIYYANNRITPLFLDIVCYVKADLSKELGFEGMSSLLEKYLDSKKRQGKRLAEAPKIPLKQAKEFSEAEYMLQEASKYWLGT